MPTIFTHGAVGFVLARTATEKAVSNIRIIVASIVLAALPDVDALFLGSIPYNHPFGHRGFTHSLFFAALVGLLVASLFSRAHLAQEHSLGLLALVFGLTIASHGFFDAMTNGGLGIAFFAPFNNARFFLPWRPIPVAPLSLEGLLNARGWEVIRAEAGLFWTFAIGAAVWNRLSLWRMLIAGACALLGIIIWVLALT